MFIYFPTNFHFFYSLWALMSVEANTWPGTEEQCLSSISTWLLGAQRRKPGGFPGGNSSRAKTWRRLLMASMRKMNGTVRRQNQGQWFRSCCRRLRGLGHPNAEEELAERKKEKKDIPGREPGAIRQNWDNSKCSQPTLSHPQDS